MKLHNHYYHILGAKGWKIFTYQFTSIKQTIHFDEHPLLRRLAGSRMIELTYRSHNAVVVPILRSLIQQGLEIHGLEECGPWRCTVFNWFPKHLRYTDFGQKPWRYTVFYFLVKQKLCPPYWFFQYLWLYYFGII